LVIRDAADDDETVQIAPETIRRFGLAEASPKAFAALKDNIPAMHVFGQVSRNPFYQKSAPVGVDKV